MTAHAKQPTLTIVADQQRLVFSQSQLLSRDDIQTISVADSVYKQRVTRFRAIRWRTCSRFDHPGTSDDSMQWRGRLLGRSAENASLEPRPQGIEGISRDRGSEEPLAGSRRKNARRDRSTSSGQIRRPPPSDGRNGHSRLSHSQFSQTPAARFRTFTLPTMQRRMCKTDSSRFSKIALHATK